MFLEGLNYTQNVDGTWTIPLKCSGGTLKTNATCSSTGEWSIAPCPGKK